MMPRKTDAVPISQEMGEELIVYHPGMGTVHCLNLTAAEVYAACDGRTPQRELAERLGPDVLRAALEQLSEAGLVNWRGRSLKRRRLLQAAVATPIVTSLALPPSANAASTCTLTNGTGECFINPFPTGPGAPGGCVSCCGDGSEGGCDVCAAANCADCACMGLFTCGGGNCNAGVNICQMGTTDTRSMSNNICTSSLNVRTAIALKPAPRLRGSLPFSIGAALVLEQLTV